MGTTEQDDQAEKLRVTLQDSDWRRQQQDAARASAQGSTFHQFAQIETLPQGRFSAPGAVSTPRVVGSTPGVAAMYPAASSAHQTELPREEPLGISVSDLDPSTNQLPPPAVEDPGPASADAPSLPLGDAQRAGAGPSSSKGSD
jgi:hypothetical protein